MQFPEIIILGGDDFNEAIAGGFLKEHQLQQKCLSETEYAILLRQAEKCKIALSTLPETKMTAVIGGQTYQSVYTNERVMREVLVSGNACSACFDMPAGWQSES